MNGQESVQLKRDCLAIAVPSGHKVIIPSGAPVDIVQALGGSFTVKTQGRLFRIDGPDADALGKEPMEKPRLPEDATDSDVEKLIWEQMKSCYDPEIPINIVDLGLVYTCKLSKLPDGGRRADIEMTLTAPGCGMGDVLANDVWQRVMEVPTVEEVSVEVVFDPPWNAAMMTDEARLQTGMF